jgi:hypothetical protein
VTVTFSSIDGTHNGWSHLDKDTAICSCGHFMGIPDFMSDMLPEDAIDELHLSHREQQRQQWLEKNGYGSIDTRWVTCVYCGCVVGLIDEHRTVCP